MTHLFFVFLISISPLGEARVGIPYGAATGVNMYVCFLAGWIASLLIFPIFYKGISTMNHYLWRYRWYKKSAVWVAKRARQNTKTSIQKYGAWGLMVFVMIPLPITGAYAGTIAAYLLKMDYKKSLIATSIGVTISCIIMTVISYLGKSIF